MSKLLSRNIFANYTGTIIQVLGPIVSLPFYLSLLGPSQFGLVSFIATLQATLGILEAGFAQVSAKEFAILTKKENSDFAGAAYYLKKFEEIFWGIAIASAIATLCMSEVIANHWLVSQSESEKKLAVEAVIGAAIIFAVQFPGALYRSYLVGTQQQVKLSTISSGSVIVRHGFGIAILYIQPTLHTYLIWQVFSYIIDTYTRRFFSWKSIPVALAPTKERKKDFHKVIRESLSMFAAVIIGAITTQMDKIILSGAIPIQQFGYYTIASTIAIGAIAAIQPAIQAISPLIMQSVNDKQALRSYNIKLAKIISAIVFSAGIIYYTFGRALLQVWLRDQHATDYIHPILSLLLIGSALNAYYHIGYYNWLAKGRTKIIFNINLTVLTTSIIATPILINKAGAIGATFAFIGMNLIGLTLSINWFKEILNRN